MSKICFPLVFIYSVLFAVFAGNAAAVDLADGLAAFYEFNGNGDDSSGLGHDAEVTGCSVDGWLAQEKSADEYAELPYTLFNGISNFTVCAFGKLSDTNTQYRHVFSCAGEDSSNELLLSYDAVNGRWYFYRGGEGYKVADDGAMSDLAWHHVAFSASNETHRLWIDGELVGSTEGAASALNVSAGGVFLGQDQDSIGGGFDADQS